MGDDHAKVVRGTYPSAEHAEREAQLLRRFLAEYPAELGKQFSDGRSDEDLQSKLSARHGFHFDECHRWGRNGSIFDEPTSVSRLGRDVYVFHSSCHGRDDLGNVFGEHLRRTGAESVCSGHNPGMVIVFEFAADCSGLDSSAGNVSGNESFSGALRAMVDYFSLSALYPKLSARESHRWLFHKDGGTIGENSSGQGGFFWCDGHRGAMYIPFDGRIDLTSAYFEGPAFARFTIAVDPTETLRPLCVLRQAMCCQAADIRAVWPEGSESFTHWQCKRCGREQDLKATAEGIGEYFGHHFAAFSFYVGDSGAPKIRLEGKSDPRSAAAAARAAAFAEAGLESVGWWQLIGARGELSGPEWPELADAGATDYCWLGVSEEEGILAVVYDTPDLGCFSEVHLLFPEGDELRASTREPPPKVRSPIMWQVYDASLGEVDLLNWVRDARGTRAAHPVSRRKAVRSLMNAFCRETAWKISQMPRALCELMDRKGLSW